MYAISVGRLDTMERMLANGCARHALAGYMAARNGQFRILKCMRSNHYDSNITHTCAGAAAGGHPHLVQWARANGVHRDSSTCSHAAMHGHFCDLKWARHNGCPWDEHTCTGAASSGRFFCHIEVGPSRRLPLGWTYVFRG